MHGNANVMRQLITSAESRQYYRLAWKELQYALPFMCVHAIQ